MRKYVALVKNVYDGDVTSSSRVGQKTYVRCCMMRTDVWRILCGSDGEQSLFAYYLGLCL